MSRTGASDRTWGHSVVLVTATTYYSAQLAASSPRLEKAQALPGSATGDRDSIISAQPTRTRFYSARSIHGGIETIVSGDCAEINPPPRRTASATQDGRNDSAQPFQSDNHESRPTVPEKAWKLYYWWHLDFRRHGKGVQGNEKGHWCVLHPRGPARTLAHPWPGYP
jgi:hypothetical protein